MSHDHSHESPGSAFDALAPIYGDNDDPVVALDAKHALAILTPQPGELILDAGCGTGRKLAAIEVVGATAVGVDLSLAMLHRGRESGCGLALADLQGGLPFAGATFDAVLCSLVGEHLTDIDAALSELARVLKPSGRIVFTAVHPEQVAATASAKHEHDHSRPHPQAERHSVQNYLDAVVDAGFDEVAFATYNGGADSGELEGRSLLFLIAATTFPSS